MGYIYNFLACRGSRLPLAKRLFYFSLFTLSFFTTPVLAQDAFYIYRNDGDFDGFFYDEVVRMGYSKIDFNGFEHDHYVVQEIETADSLYRIPLAVIDSIGFQQPEIKLNPNLRDFHDDGLLDYIVEINAEPSDKVRRILVRNSCPSNLMPKVGQVLIDTHTEYYWDEEAKNYRHQWLYCKGFAGKVTEVKYYNNDYTQVICNPLSELGDVFVQFVTTERVTIDEDGQVKRRLAGWHPERNKVLRAEEGSEDVSLIDFTGTIKREFSPAEDVTITMAAEIGLKLGIKVDYYISWKRLYVKTDINSYAGISPSVGIKASKSFDADIEVMKLLRTIKFPVNLPIFQTHPIPNIDVRGGGEIALNATLPGAKLFWNQTIIFDTDRWPIMSYTHNYNTPEEDEGKEAPIDTGDLEVSLAGFVQMGVEMTGDIETNDWIEDIFKSGIGVSLFVGPKLEGSLKLSVAKLASDDAYSALKDSYIKLHALSLDLEAKAELKFLWKDPEKTTFFERSEQFGTLEWFLLPDFKEIDAVFDKQDDVTKVTLYPDRKTFVPSYVGIALYNYKRELLEKRYDTFSHFFTTPREKFETKFEGLPCGQYYVTPCLSTLGYELSVGGPTKYFTVTPTIDFTEKEYKFGGEAEKKDIYFKTNSQTFDITFQKQDPDDSTIWYRGDWATVSVTDIDAEAKDAYLHIELPKNPSLFTRKGRVILTARAGSIAASDTIYIEQLSTRTDVKSFGLSAAIPATKNSEETIIVNGNATHSSSTSSSTISASYPYPVTCERKGNILTFTGNHSYTDSSNNNYVYQLSLVVDASEKPGKIIRGSCRMTRDYPETPYTKDEYHRYYNYLEKRTESIDASDYSEYLEWEKEIPLGDYSEYSDGTCKFSLNTKDLPAGWATGSASGHWHYYRKITEFNGDGEITKTTETDETYASSYSPSSQDDNNGRIELAITF